MRWLLCMLVLAITTACGGAPVPTRHSGPDVVTAEWTAGDDAVLEGADAGVPR